MIRPKDLRVEGIIKKKKKDEKATFRKDGEKKMNK